jgi:pre-mRNA-splicing factor ATP-dependent RNA helicase DHX15/PRP43
MKRQRLSLFDQPGEAAVSATVDNGNGAGGAVMNKYTGRPFSQRYYDILEKRQGLPVWQQRDDFIKIMNSHQTLVLVGETGSGKTTQVGGFRRL